jgi:hypothetical protein
VKRRQRPTFSHSHEVTMSRLHRMRPMFVMAALACFLAGLAVPAHADDRDRHDRRDFHPHRDWHHDRGYAPETVYAPPPVVYTPPAPVAPGINLIVPLNFR